MTGKVNQAIETQRFIRSRLGHLLDMPENSLKKLQSYNEYCDTRAALTDKGTQEWLSSSSTQILQ